MTTALWLETLDFCEWDLREAGRVRVTQLGRAAAGRVTAAPTLSGAAESYSAFSGRPPPSPAWVEGGAIVGAEGGTAAVLRVLAAIDAAAPTAALAGVWLQDWCGARDNTARAQMPFYGVYWSWAVNETQYPGWHATLLPALAARGARVLVYVNPMLMPGPLRAEALAHGFLVRLHSGELFDYDGQGTALVNVGDPAAAAWLAGVLQRNVLGEGGANASGWMADFGEGFPPAAAGALPSAHGLFPAAWAGVNAAAVAGAGRAGEAAFFMRSASPRSPGLATAFWLGDQLVSWDAFDGLASAVPALLSSSLHGGGITHTDIGGYTGVQLAPPLANITLYRSKELFMRWAELAAFTFMFRTHLGTMPSRNWQLTDDAETIQHFFAMANVFAGLGGYRARVRANATGRGTPPFHATAELFAGAPWGLVSQFLLGEELLVAPVLAPGAGSVQVWLPAGTAWRHALNASVVVQGEGGFVGVEAPIGLPCALWRQ